MKTLKHYPGLMIMPVELYYEGKLCAGGYSVMQTTTVQTTGQLSGETIDIQSSPDFNHVWE